MIGNAILRAVHLERYTNNGAAAQIGAVCGAIFGSFISLLDLNIIIRTLATVILGALGGTSGAAVLLRAGKDLGGIDVLHATRAGALGSTICIPATLLLIWLPWRSHFTAYLGWNEFRDGVRKLRNRDQKV